MWLYHRVTIPNDADRMANSVDPDQTAPLVAVWSGSALFAQAYLSENLGSLRYLFHFVMTRIMHSSGGLIPRVSPPTPFGEETLIGA